MRTNERHPIVTATTLASILFLTCTAHATAADDALNNAIIELTPDTPWVIAPGEAEAVQRALRDVQGDWYKVLGHRPVMLAELPKDYAGPLVYFGMNGPWFKDLVTQPWPGAESYVMRAQRDTAGRQVIIATGADVRGTIYAAYALSEHVLGVDPWYHWVDREPAYVGAVRVPANLDRSSGPPTFRFRGWFINDEDLLGGYSPDPLRETVFSLDAWDRICETLLRLRGNMLVPGTFTFPDERCQTLAARRGLVLNMHHILVVGLNTYRWPTDVPFSYSKSPQVMDRYWQTCIDAFKDKEVVWTVGYRGKHDRPFWADEPEIATPPQRGELISRAIARQVELIRKAQPKAAIIANLWIEGADLYHAGHLKIPDGVTIVWPDDGTGLIRDDGRVRAGQGIYYHTAMLNNSANQLSEMVNPDRIRQEMGRFARAGAQEFFLVNTSDIRPVVLSTDFAMKMAWDAATYGPEKAGPVADGAVDPFVLDWCGRQFGPAAAPTLAKLYGDYFDLPYHRRDVRQGENSLHTRLRQLDRLAWPAFETGQALGPSAVRAAQVQQAYAQRPFDLTKELQARAESAEALIPPGRQDFYVGHLLTQARIHRYSTEMLLYYAKAVQDFAAGRKAEATADLQQSLSATDALFAALRRAEYGKWAKWYVGETFVQLDRSRDLVRLRLAQLKGEPRPPLRTPHTYEDLYDYQLPFAPNFPLLYPSHP